MHRRRGPPGLRIDAPAPTTQIALVVDDDAASSASDATDDSEQPPFSAASRNSSMRNLKRLAISIPSASSSDGSFPPSAKLPPPPTPQLDLKKPERQRRPSVVSLPAVSNPVASLLHRKEEDGAEDVPYADGPVQVIPGIWIGSEENARDWKGLIERGIKAILNVAKEVSSPFDTAPRGLRAVSSTPNFRKSQQSDSTYYPPHLPSGRPGMHYLKLQWSHGQQDLVNNGFQAAMSFVDDALSRSEGVLVHCQCGISRSATMVIALVMRAAAERSRHVPPEVWALKGMQGAYSFVKEKSPIVGPNMQTSVLSISCWITKRRFAGNRVRRGSGDSFSKDEEWSRLRQAMAESDEEDGPEDVENSAIMQEARYLDKAMEDRIVARKTSSSSIGSNGSGIGMGPAWRSRYGGARKRTGSINSFNTNNSAISEDLLEEDEEEALLGVGGGFDSERPMDGRTAEESSASNSPDDDNDDASDIPPFAPLTAKAFSPVLGPPPSAPAWRTSFQALPPPPATAVRSTFNLPPLPPVKGKRRPLSMSISVLPAVPSSPIVIEQDTTEPSPAPVASSLPAPRPFSVRKRAESTKLAPPPLHLRSSVLRRASQTYDASIAAGLSTPSQTLFVFPPSPTLTTRTPSTMTLTSEAATGPVPFPTISTPRISTFRQKGGRKLSFIGVGSPPTPTVGFSKVDARGYVGFPS
ncbi:hypothetical protein DFP72DRAFT_1039030 [Ephemerocybe angulata]|uniref:protein-tyrosine-phosphatase n=1 Tax=Ephemerocybe angulata TaxID=980116 RepID=A0A8H6IJ36_9AGAR|nr:hypothetical protein DFP72DRAFT_1039030 [Tulosesus angulatus]